MAKLVAIAEQSTAPLSGRWVWKDDTNTLEFVGNPTGGERQVGKRDRRLKPVVHFPDHGKRTGTARISSSSRFGSGRRSGRQCGTKGIVRVTLNNVKMLAYDMMSDVEEMSPSFEKLVFRYQFDDFLSCLLNYFHYFFEKKVHEGKPNPMNIEPSDKEKRYYADLCIHVENAQKLLGSAYCVLVLGIGLGEQHHMARGMSRVSNTYQDRCTYETMYTFCAFAVWIAFKRKDFDTVKKEIFRILRSDTFNPCLRVKNAPEDDEKEREKITPAQYRRNQGNRPPIKSIILQRSPALVSILPTPKEASGWLFKGASGLSAGSLVESMRIGDKEQEELLESLQLASLSRLVDLNLKLGIIGDPMRLFNKTTLVSVGAEHESEEEKNESEELRKHSGLTSSQLKAMQAKDGSLSRESTGMSATTVEALPDED